MSKPMPGRAAHAQPLPLENIDDADARLAHSWRTNAAAWTDAVREQRIASRRAGTDAAIVAAVLQTNARRVLDLGCGEGWLSRALGTHGREVVGTDASPELIEAARGKGGARFDLASYAELLSRGAECDPFDAIVCNFSLLAEDVRSPLQAARTMLVPDGVLIVQTVHPWAGCTDAPHVDGWRLEAFENFGGTFREPMPWYFRTLASWIAALRSNGFAVVRIDEPLDPQTRKPLSLLMQAIHMQSTCAK